MHYMLYASLMVLAAAAGARSTWSPCGRSMLSTITPLGERGRTTSYASSAAWFIVGASAGGASLGIIVSLLSQLVWMARLPDTGALATISVFGLVTAASDLRIRGRALPFHRRQVNELWLDRFRPWVYASSFGWQIGFGLATYVTTAAIYLMIVVGIVAASPVAAFASAVVFGLVRGLAVLLGHNVTTTARLVSFHARLDALDRPAIIAIAVVQVGVSMMAATLLGAPAVALVTVLGVTAVVILSMLRSHESSEHVTTKLASSPFLKT